MALAQFADWDHEKSLVAHSLGQPADIVAYPEATHQWDNPASTGGRHLSMGPGRGTTFVRYDAETTRDSVARAVAHFRATL